MNFEFWHIWLIIALICFIMEIFIPSFVLFNFGIGALAGSLVAGLELSIEWQIIAFSVGTLLSFFTIRPAMKKFAYQQSDNTLTNVQAMIGRQAKVIETINSENNHGRVMLDGDEWKAKSLTNEQIPANSVVEIVQIDSIILTVKTIS